jgi:hypothetical protein
MLRRIGPGLLLLGGIFLLTPACTSWDGHFEICGYTTRPNYDTNIHTIYLPIFENKTYYRGLEFLLDQALQRQIGWKTPYRITSNKAVADTELTGSIISITKNVALISPSNGTRVQEQVLIVALTWKDLRTGEVLSRRQRRPGEPVPLDLPPPGANILPGVTMISPPTFPTPLTQDIPGQQPPPGGSPAVDPRPPETPPGGPPLNITTSVTFVPELGESTASATLKNIEKMAIQIINMMQIPW